MPRRHSAPIYAHDSPSDEACNSPRRAPLRHGVHLACPECKKLSEENSLNGQRHGGGASKPVEFLLLTISCGLPFFNKTSARLKFIEAAVAKMGRQTPRRCGCVSILIEEIL